MSNAARKARKRSGIKFIHPTKVGTPFLERAWMSAVVIRTDLFGKGGIEAPALRSFSKRKRAAEARGLTIAKPHIAVTSDFK
jgi:hypothetical protein